MGGCFGSGTEELLQMGDLDRLFGLGTCLTCVVRTSLTCLTCVVITSLTGRSASGSSGCSTSSGCQYHPKRQLPGPTPGGGVEGGANGTGGGSLGSEGRRGEGRINSPRPSNRLVVARTRQSSPLACHLRWPVRVPTPSLAGPLSLTRHQKAPGTDRQAMIEQARE